MRVITADKITRAVRDAYMEMNTISCRDVNSALEESLLREESRTGKSVIKQILENNEYARQENIAMCQDTGMAVLFAELGQEVYISGCFEEAVNRGVHEAYTQGFLRKSVVDDPVFDRVNTGDNTPAIIHIRLVEGGNLMIHACAKGFGSENMSRLKMLVPADGAEGILDFISETVEIAGPNPCPPVIVGVGIGGTMEKSAQLAKLATIRELGLKNPNERYARLEERALARINALGIGPGGLGGKITALGVNIEYSPTHIAGMPVAVNICCHASRHRTFLL